MPPTRIASSPVPRRRTWTMPRMRLVCWRSVVAQLEVVDSEVAAQNRRAHHQLQRVQPLGERLGAHQPHEHVHRLVARVVDGVEGGLRDHHPAVPDPGIGGIAQHRLVLERADHRPLLAGDGQAHVREIVGGVEELPPNLVAHDAHAPPRGHVPLVDEAAAHEPQPVERQRRGGIGVHRDVLAPAAKVGPAVLPALARGPGAREQGGAAEQFGVALRELAAGLEELGGGRLVGLDVDEVRLARSLAGAQQRLPAAAQKAGQEHQRGRADHHAEEGQRDPRPVAEQGAMQPTKLVGDAHALRTCE